MIFFKNLLDIAAFNAAVVFFVVNPDFDKGKPQRRRLFLERLAMDMIAESQCCHQDLFIKTKTKTLLF